VEGVGGWVGGGGAREKNEWGLKKFRVFLTYQKFVLVFFWVVEIFFGCVCMVDGCGGCGCVCVWGVCVWIRIN